MPRPFAKKTKNLKNEDIKKRAEFFKKAENTSAELNKACREIKQFYKELDSATTQQSRNKIIEKINKKAQEIKSLNTTWSKMFENPLFDKNNYLEPLTLNAAKTYLLVKFPEECFKNTKIYQKISSDNFMLIKGKTKLYDVIAPKIDLFDPNKKDITLQHINQHHYEARGLSETDASDFECYNGNYFASLKNYLENPPTF